MMKLRLARPGADRHQRPDRPVHRIRLDGSAIAIQTADRPRTARLAPARRALRHLPRRRQGHRRPHRAQPGHHRRLVLPGRPVRGSGRGRLGARRRAGRPLGRGRAPCRPASSTPAPTRRRWATARSSPRSGCPSGPVRAAPTRRSSGEAGDWAIARARAFVALDGDLIGDVGADPVGAARYAPGRGRPAGPAAHRREPGCRRAAGGRGLQP